MVLEEAVVLAERSGDRELLDRTRCNRAAVAIELGEGAHALQGLREILLAQRSSATAFLAAYNLAEAYQLERQHRKALFYAQIAHERARATERSGWIASSLNRLGNLHVALNQLGAAREAYTSASELVPASDARRFCPILQNLGYVDALEGDCVTGLGRLYAALRGLRAAEISSPLIHLDLAWTLLQVGRADHARRHADRALRLAQSQRRAESHRAETRKAALLLAGQAARELGDEAGAEQYCLELASLYPSYDQLFAVFGVVNLLPAVNLRA